MIKNKRGKGNKRKRPVITKIDGVKVPQSKQWNDFLIKKFGDNVIPPNFDVNALNREFKEERERQKLLNKNRNKVKKNVRILHSKTSGVLTDIPEINYKIDRKILHMDPRDVGSFIPKLADMNDSDLSAFTNTIISTKRKISDSMIGNDIDRALDKIRRIGIERGGHLILLLGHNDYFEWPSTLVISGGNSSLSQVAWHKDGILSYFGYHVGNTISLEDSERRQILDHVFRAHLLFDIPEFVKVEWGPAETASRLKKMANTIASLTRNAKGRKNLSAYRLAIAEWESDLAYLRQEYYVSRFKFDWPRTSD